MKNTCFFSLFASAILISACPSVQAQNQADDVSRSVMYDGRICILAQTRDHKFPEKPAAGSDRWMTLLIEEGLIPSKQACGMMVAPVREIQSPSGRSVGSEVTVTGSVEISHRTFWDDNQTNSINAIIKKHGKPDFITTNESAIASSSKRITERYWFGPVALTVDPASQKIVALALRGDLLKEISETGSFSEQARNGVDLAAFIKGKMDKPKAASEKNLLTDEEFLIANAKKEGVKTTASGLQYRLLKPGAGKVSPKATDTVNVHYHGTLIDGSVFDSSVERGKPISFPLGRVIVGWTEGLQMMKEGDKFQFVIPGKLAYGERGAAPKIGPNATLIFDVELLAIEKD